MPTLSILVTPPELKPCLYVRRPNDVKIIAARLSISSGLKSGSARQDEHDSSQSRSRLNHVLGNSFSAIGDQRIWNSNVCFSSCLRSPCLPTATITMSEKSHDIPPLDYSPSPDWDALRLQSLAPGGFGSARAYIWHASVSTPPFPHFLELYSRPRLLHVHPDLDVNLSPQNSHNEHDPHQDERQIRLDTDRSFVLYPVGDAHSDPTPFHYPPTPNLQMTARKTLGSSARQSSTSSSLTSSDDARV